jgi:hypothetical protein
MKCPYEPNIFCPYRRITEHRFRYDGPLPLSVNTKEIRLSNNKIDEYLRIPVYTGKISPEIIENINNNFYNDIMEFKTEIEKSAEDNWSKMKSEGKAPIPFQVSNIYNTTYNNNGILSTTLLYQEFINGINNFIKTSYNYDLSTGKSLSLKDLFLNNVNYKEVLDSIIRNQLAINPQDYFPNSLKNFKGISMDQPFYLDDGNLVVFFGFNEIAPISSNIPTIKIPLSEIKGYLKPKYCFNC